MTLFHLVLVALIQGLTEFLPVSSSGHLILLPAITGMEDQGQLIDISVHVGTLFAVILYFRQDVRVAANGVPRLLRGKVDTQGAWLAMLLVIATIPVLLFGLFLKVTGLDDHLRSVALIGWTMILFGLVLYWTDQKGATEKKAPQWSMKDAFKMGLWQALALIPGTSRSGATISGARALGYAREDAAKLAMLMSIPTILASGVVLGAEVINDANLALARDAAIAALLSFIAALFCADIDDAIA